MKMKIDYAKNDYNSDNYKLKVHNSLSEFFALGCLGLIWGLIAVKFIIELTK